MWISLLCLYMVSLPEQSYSIGIQWFVHRYLRPVRLILWTQVYGNLDQTRLVEFR